MFDIIRKIAWIFIIILITVAAIPEIPSKGKQLSRISETQSANDDSMPRFAEPIPNVTVSVGRDALLACVVENLKGFKVAWVRVDTQTILSIHHNVITQNSRISLSYNDHRSWYLHIKEVEESDRGWYMCQVNTDPMRSRKGYLQVVVPPMIIESMTSNDMVVREGTNVTLMCKARGYPEPYVMWRREDGEEMNIGGENVNVVDGEILQITKVSRLHMAAYLCVASNGVPPSISKRVHLRVQFPPMLSIANQLEGAYVGQEVTLECETEAYPASINYWTTERGDMIISDTSRAGDKFETTSLTRGYQKFMKLKIRNVGANDFGSYRCVAKNSLGETDGIIKLDEIPTPTTAVVSGDITSFNRTLAGKRPHNRKFEPNAIPDYGLEEWKDVGGDTNQPPSVRHPPGAFHNKASSGYSINSYNKLTPTLYWLSRPFDGIKSSTLSLITTSFWWLNMKTSIPTTNILPKISKNTATLKNNINLPQILIMSPNKININNHQHNFANINNNLGKFSILYHYYNSGQQQEQQQQQQEQQYQHQKKPNNDTTIQLNKQFKENTIMMIKSTTIITTKMIKIIINDNKIFGYCCDSKKLLNNFSTNINNKNNINNNVTVINITDIDNDCYTNNVDNDVNDYDDDANDYNNNLILFLIQIFKCISFILYDNINFHIIKLIQFLRMNFHIFIMLSLNLISVNLVKNILLLPVVISSTTEKILYKTSSSSSSEQSSSLSTKTIEKPTFSSSTFTTQSTSFELEKILEKNISKRTFKNIPSSSSSSLSLSSLSFLSLSSSISLQQNLQKIEYGNNNSYKLMSFILNPSIQPRRRYTNIISKTISTEKNFQDQNDDNINKNIIINNTTTVIINNNNDSEIILNSNNINKDNNNSSSSSNSSNKKSNSNSISINNNISKSYNLNECIKMSKANVSNINEKNFVIITITTTTTEERIKDVREVKNISRVNR